MSTRPDMDKRPREGAYLDATLGVIGEQLEERIDEISRRRRLARRVGTIALAATTLLGGSAAAYAVVQAQHEPPTPPAAAASESLQLACVEGADASAAAYFTVTYRAAGDADIDATAVCADAMATLASDRQRIAQASPADLVRIATTLLGAEPAADLTVQSAAFGSLSAETAERGSTCEGTEAMTVLAPSPGSQTTRVYSICTGTPR